MNYYERHLGDYAKDTLHLSMLEHGAYTLLMDRYYSTERGIPADQVYRVALARSKDEKAAVDTVLTEFFTLNDGVFTKGRIEEEIEKYLSGEPEREAKKANEKNRLSKHREERSMLFKILTDAGQHATWNIGISELRELVKNISATSIVTLPATAPATPATATQTPDTRHQVKNLSVTNVTGGEPPKITDPEEIIFGYGLTMLVAAGTPDKNARSFLGGLRKGYGDAALVDKLRECAKAKPLQPVEWLAAAMPPGGAASKIPKPDNFAEKNYGSEITAL